MSAYHVCDQLPAPILQVIMAMFSYVYYWTYINTSGELSVGDVLDTAVQLRDPQQVELFCKLGNLLVGESLLPGAGTRGLWLWLWMLLC